MMTATGRASCRSRSGRSEGPATISARRPGGTPGIHRPQIPSRRSRGGPARRSDGAGFRSPWEVSCYRIQESLHLESETTRSLDVRQMSDTRKNDKPGSMNALRQLLGRSRRIDEVLVAHQDETRSLDEAKPLPHVVFHRGPGLPAECVRILRPGIALGEL